MCDEYDDERMTVFWRNLAQLERKPLDEPEHDAEPLIRIEPTPAEPLKPKPRALTR